MIKGKDVLDVGCGKGKESVAIAIYGAKNVLGIDINKNLIKEGKKSANQKVSFLLGDATRMCVNANSFDVIISKDSMEHFMTPEKVFAECERVLRRGGYFYISFGPPWLSPYGSHMHFFTKVPWVNMLFSEETIMAVRNRFRNDGGKNYGDAGLNQMTIRRFNRIVESSNLRKVSFSLKGVPLLTNIPFIKEFFSTRAICILQKP